MKSYCSFWTSFILSGLKGFLFFKVVLVIGCKNSGSFDPFLWTLNCCLFVTKHMNWQFQFSVLRSFHNFWFWSSFTLIFIIKSGKCWILCFWLVCTLCLFCIYDFDYSPIRFCPKTTHSLVCGNWFSHEACNFLCSL